MIEFTRLLVSQVKTMLPNARTIVTVKQPFGEYHAKFRSSVPPVLYAEMVAQAGINFEAFGLEIEMGIPQPGKFTRDLFQLSCLLDKFSSLGRPIFITAVGAPGQNGPDSGDISDGRMNPAEAGRWKRPWDPYACRRSEDGGGVSDGAEQAVRRVDCVEQSGGYSSDAAGGRIDE